MIKGYTKCNQTNVSPFPKATASEIQQSTYSRQIPQNSAAAFRQREKAHFLRWYRSFSGAFHRATTTLPAKAVLSTPQSAENLWSCVGRTTAGRAYDTRIPEASGPGLLSPRPSGRARCRVEDLTRRRDGFADIGDRR